jgi:hypothetical protein
MSPFSESVKMKKDEISQINGYGGERMGSIIANSVVEFPIMRWLFCIKIDDDRPGVVLFLSKMP